MSEVIFNVKSIITKLKEILKCDICNNLFDFNNHIPLITKSGETYCKKCLQENKNILNKCNNNENNSETSLSSFKFIENIKLKKIINDIINLYDKVINEKYINFSKQLTDRNSNPRYGHYLLTYNNSSAGLKENSSSEYIYNNPNKKMNSLKKSINSTKNLLYNNKINLDYNNNLQKVKKENDNNNKDIQIENKEKIHKIISKEINLKNTKKNNSNSNNSNKMILKTLYINNLNISDNDDNLNTMQFNDEINVNFFGDKDNNMKEIDDESIDTIPINEEKSIVNMSFKKEFTEFWLKNDEIQVELINQNNIKNDLNKYVFINKNNLIYKNNQKATGSTLNIKNKKDKITKEKEKENKFLYQLSEPNFENINLNKLNNKCYDLEMQKINNKKEEEKSCNVKVNNNEIKKIYSNSKYYDYSNKASYKNITENDSNTKLNPIKNNNENKFLKEYHKIKSNKYQAYPRQIVTREIKRKIEEDENGENNIKYKNLTSIKDNNIKKYNDKDILFDEDEIKIVIKDIKNKYDNEEEKKISSINKNKENNSYENNNELKVEQNNDDKSVKSRYTNNNSKVKHTITYNKKILGKTNFSPMKNNSIENALKNNINKFEYFKKINCSINNKSKFRTISQAKTNDELINNNNISNNEIIEDAITIERNSESINKNNQNNLKRIQKITSIYLKIDNQKQHNNNNIKNSQNTSNNSDNKNYDEDKIKNSNDENNISIKKAKTFMNKTKDELDNLYMGNNLNIKNKINVFNNNLISKNKNNNFENKSNEFHSLFQQKLTKEKNLAIKNTLLKNKIKYEEIIKKSLNCPLFNDSKEGDIKMLFLPNNDFYIGIISSQNNLPQKGILYSLDGNYYEGTFLKGKKEGKGIIIYKNGAKYEGEIKNNLHNGVGKLSQLDGEVFIGEWKEGKINGNGVRYHNNGDIYSGHYINSIRDGTGKYIFSNGDSYEGKWKNGKANGKGIYKFKNGNIYEGNFENNNFCGQGCFKKKKGDIYFGEFKNGVLNGEGTIINKDKEKFVGTFKNGKKQGKGVLYDKNGNIIKSGIWDSNKYVMQSKIDEE